MSNCRPSMFILLTVVLLALWPADTDKMRLGGIDPVELSATATLTKQLATNSSQLGSKSGGPNKRSTFMDQIHAIENGIHTIENRIRSSFDYANDDEPLEGFPKINDQVAQNEPLSPIVMIPGYGGSQLEARWDRETVESFLCDAKSNWTDIWVNLKLLFPYFIDCLIGMMKLNFNRETQTTHNALGVEIRVRQPDNLATVEYFNKLQLPAFRYFAPVVKKLIKLGIGYKRNVSIRGAPYDFRKAPNELADYFNDLKSKTERLFKQSNNSPVTYICHSMGCNNILYLLQRQSKAWKNKYVRRLISIAAPWAGSVAALRAIAFGDNLNIPLLFDEAKLNLLQKSLPSTIYLLPHPRLFASVPLIISHEAKQANQSQLQQTTYKADDYKKFFTDIKHPDGYEMWKLTNRLLGNLEAPQVEVWCLFGKNRPTLSRLKFEGNFPGSKETGLYDDGDGTVTIQSSNFCKEWSKEQSQPVHLLGFSSSHNELLTNTQVLNTIANIVKNNNDHNDCGSEEGQG